MAVGQVSQQSIQFPATDNRIQHIHDGASLDGRNKAITAARGTRAEYTLRPTWRQAASAPGEPRLMRRLHMATFRSSIIVMCIIRILGAKKMTTVEQVPIDVAGANERLGLGIEFYKQVLGMFLGEASSRIRAMRDSSGARGCRCF